MIKQYILNQMQKSVYVAIGFSIFTFIFGFILSNGLIVFLSWNIALAIGAYLLSFMTLYAHQKQANKYVVWIGVVLWILFFPNSFYILTDTIHFQNYEFFNMYPNTYQLEIYDWYIYFVVTIAMMIGIKLGLLSISNIKKMIPITYHKYQIIGLIILFISSSIAIYLGRFIRLNSWNILDISTILSGIFNHFSFFLMFISLFTIIHLIIYILFKEREIE